MTILTMGALAPLAAALPGRDHSESAQPPDQSAQWLRKFFEHAADAYHLHSTDGVIIDGNRVAERLIGFRREQVIGKSVLELGVLSSEQLPRVAQMLARSACGQPAGPEEFRVDRADGTHSLIETRTYPVNIGGQDLVLSISRDVTDHKRAEQQLRRERDFANALIQNSPAFFVAVDADGRVIMMSDTMLRALGYRLDQVVGAEYLPTFVPSEDHPPALKAVADLRDGKRPAPYEARLLTRDGSELLVQWHHSAVLTECGRFDYHFGVGIDVTTTRKLERQLWEVQKMEAVGVLAGGIAHDFNNVLASIMGRASLMLTSGELDQAAEKQLWQVVEGCDRGASLVQRLLTFSRQVEPRKKRMDLRETVEESCKLLADSISKLIRISVTVADDLWPVEADPYQIEQALLNLAINAAEAMPEGGTLTITAANFTADDPEWALARGLDPAAPHVLLSVTDTGPGVNADVRNHIFEPFFTSKSRAGHSGLGLAVVHGIVQSHGGLVEVPPRQTGAEFRIYLPAAGQAAASALSEDSTAGPSRHALVLVVDDEPALTRLTADILDHHGHRVLVAHNGAEALALFASRQREIDLVILDLLMPVMDGQACLRQLRHICPEVPVLLMSGHVPSPTMRRRLDRMVSGLLAKPFTVEEMTTAVDAILRGRQVPGADL